MYISDINIKHYGAIKNAQIKAKFYDNGNPKPLIITGHNGSGKTLLLTNLVDSMIAIQQAEGRGKEKEDINEIYKLENKKYIHTGANESIVKIRFMEKDQYADYINVVSKNVHQSMMQEEIQVLNVRQKFLETGCYKNIIKTHASFKKQVIAYFPTDRYYNPAWFEKKEGGRVFYKKNSKNKISEASKIIKGNLLEEVEEWILDVLLDKYLYEQLTELKEYYIKMPTGDYIPAQVNQVYGYKGKNTMILTMINNLLSVIYTCKYNNIQYARIGVSNKKTRAISIFIKKHDEPEIEMASDFSFLSSGEIMVLSLFVSIIKEYDLLNTGKEFKFEEVEGIVIIDEIDQNLHIRFVKEILPILIKTFPRIQFVLTTHSPFFLMGMQEYLGKDFSYISMPDGREKDELEGYMTIKACYNVVCGY